MYISHICISPNDQQIKLGPRTPYKFSKNTNLSLAKSDLKQFTHGHKEKRKTMSSKLRHTIYIIRLQFRISLHAEDKVLLSSHPATV